MTGFPVAYSLAAVNAVLSCVAVTVVAVLIVGVSGYRAARINPEGSLRE